MKTAPQIFISYVRRDKREVEALYKKLAAAGYKPWMDREDVIAGERWKAKIQRAIKEADFFLACLSTHSVNRRGFLQKELKDALESYQEKLPDDIFIIPVRLEECKVPEDLGDFQWVDLFDDDGWERLLKAIQVGMSRRASDRRAGDRRGGDRRASDRRAAGDSSAASAATPGAEVAAREESPRPSSPMPLGGSPAKASDGGGGGQRARELPIVSFPDELSKFIRDVAPKEWASVERNTQRFLITLGTKLEPIVQIIPPTPVPLVLGFENLALGALGEDFARICRRTANFDPGLLRLLLTLAAMKTTSMLRINAARDGKVGERHLLFTMNLDPEMLDCSHIEDLLDRYRDLREKNVLFEVNEKTTLQYLDRLKTLQVDFNLRYCADDFNRWAPEVKDALKSRVEMSKVDYTSFREAMQVRGDKPEEAIKRIAVHRIPGKPLIVEGVENQNYLRFLNNHWPFHKLGHLYGQGYIIKPGSPWETWTADLRDFGLPGGHILAKSLVKQSDKNVEG